MACLVASPIEIAFHEQQQQRQLELQQQQELQERQSHSLQSAMFALDDGREQQLYVHDPHGLPPGLPPGPFNAILDD
jgi:hypothetical protein